MFIPIKAAAYFSFWVSYHMGASSVSNPQEHQMSCSTTVHHVITNEEYYNINDTIESVLIKEE
jgi:hypothetical protein